MSDSQAGLDQFAGSGGAEDGTGHGDRPTEEAAHVAGTGQGRVSAVVDREDIVVPDSEGTVEFMVTAVYYTVEGAGAEEYPVVHVFGRTADNEPEHVRVLGIEPYFYVPTADIEGRTLSEEYYVILDSREMGPDGERFESIRGEPVTKVIARTPRDVGQIRDDFERTYEADILFPNRFLIDHGVTSGVRVEERRLDARTGEDRGRLQVTPDHLEPCDVDADIRVNTFDIEVDDRNGFPEDGEEPIVCLTSHDSYRDEYIAWLYDAPVGGVDAPAALDGYEQIGDRDSDVEVRTFAEEDAMLDAFVSYIDGTDPDVLTGWNCLPANSCIAMADGTETPIRDIDIGDTVIGSENETPTTATVTNKWRSEREVLEFELADGGALRSSAEHRVMVGDDDSVDWKDAGDISAGEYVLKPRKLPVESSSIPTLADLVSTENQRYRSEDTVKEFKSALPYGAVSELAETFDLSKGTLYHPKTDVWTPKRCKQAAEEYGIAIPDGGVRYRRTDTDLSREITRHELYLAGLVLTDGTMSRDEGIRFYNTRRELHDQFPEDGALQPDGKGCFKQNVLDYARLHAFNELGIPFGNKNETDVDLSTVYQLPEDYIARFLAGVIDGDGSVGTTVTVAAENESIGEWYVKLFKRLGVYAERADNVVRVPDAERELSTLRERVSPYMNHPEKVDALSSLQGGKSGRSEDIPYALFEAETGTDAKRIGRDKHRRGIALKRHETDRDSWDDYVFVEIESVETVGAETTYDIETTTHNFVAEECLVHNCEDFDVPYFFDRMEELDRPSEYDLSPDRLSRVNETWRSGWGGPDVKGRVVFDLLYAYQRTQFSELESYRLDAVGELELDVGKERYTGDIGDLWEQDPERLLEYNVRDVELCVEIDRKQKIVAFWDDARKFVGCQLEDAPTPGDAVDMYVLHNAFGDFVLPTKGQQASEDFEGGAVFEPISGVEEMVSVLDLKSLYPMCMVTINASPETIVDDPDAFDGETYRAPNGTRFRKEPDGMMREMVDELLTERERLKGARDEHDPGSDAYEQYDRQQASVKVIMNSLYGVSGWDRFRLYDKDNAAAITAMGRRVIEFTEETAREIDHEVTYGDTDSIMLALGSDISTEEAIEQSFEIEEHINGRYDDFAREELDAEEHRFEIEFEKLYRRFFQAGKKKRYAGHIVWKEGKDVDDIDITGFEYKRSDIAPVTKRVQKRVIEMIVHGEDTEDITDYLHDEIQNFLDGDADLDEVGIPGGIGKRLESYDTDTAQVRGAKYANLMLGTNFQRGSKPKRLYLEKIHPDFWARMENEHGLDPQTDPLYGEFKRDPDVICFEYADEVPEEFAVDWDKMLDKTLKGPIARIIEALGMSWEEVKSGQEQTGLGSFM